MGNAYIIVDGSRYDLLLSNRATKEISERYGGLEKLGEKLMRADSFEMALDEICWLVALLANQAIKAHNLRTPDQKKTMLDIEELEILTTPGELMSFQGAIAEALTDGMRREIMSADDGKKKAED